MQKIKKLIGKGSIQKKVEALAKKISRDYRSKDVVFIGILKGAIVFLSDIIRNVSIPVSIDIVQLSSYGVSSTSSGIIEMKKKIDINIKGKHVLVVEDIVDCGYTLDFLLKHLSKRKPASLNVCVLLDKVARRKVKVPLKYRGFKVPDKFMVGYGLDFKEKWRNLPYIGFISEK